MLGHRKSLRAATLHFKIATPLRPQRHPAAYSSLRRPDYREDAIRTPRPEPR